MNGVTSIYIHSIDKLGVYARIYISYKKKISQIYLVIFSIHSRKMSDRCMRKFSLVQMIVK